MVDERGVGEGVLLGLEERELGDWVDEDVLIEVVLLKDESGLVGDERLSPMEGLLSCPEPLKPMGTKAGDLDSLNPRTFFFFFGCCASSQELLLRDDSDSEEEEEVALCLEVLLTLVLLLLVMLMSCFAFGLSDEMTMVESPTLVDREDDACISIIIQASY